MRVAAILFLPLLAAALFGCGTTFKEKYHFRAVGNETTNYYRVVIEGHAWFTQSQYASGVYDKKAVDALFGELTGARVTAERGLSQPRDPFAEEAKGKEPGQDSGSGTSPTDTPSAEDVPSRDASSGGSSSTSNLDSDPSGNATEAARLESLDGKSMDDQRLVLFLSANSNAIVNQIRAFVRNEQMQQSMVTMIVKDDRARLEIAKERNRPKQANADALAASLEAIAAQIESEASLTQATANTRLSEALSALSRASSAPASAPFANVNAARKWASETPLAFSEAK